MPLTHDLNSTHLLSYEGQTIHTWEYAIKYRQQQVLARMWENWDIVSGNANQGNCLGNETIMPQKIRRQVIP